jgi:hypothetical protein
MTSPAYFVHGGKWHVAPNQEIDANDVMRNRIEFDSGQDVLEGALVYKIQMRQHIESDEFIQDELKVIELLVVWSFERTKGLHVRALLIEHDEKFDEDKLKKLYQVNADTLDARVEFIGSNWLLNDVTILMTAVKVMNGGYRCDIFISEGIQYNVKKPIWIDAER